MNYPTFVDMKNIVIDDDTEDIAFRYSLKIPLESTGSCSVLVIMMNPAEANADISDATINRLLNYIQRSHKSYGTVTVANLYPLYEPSSSNLKLHKDQCDLNIRKIKELFSNVDSIILGWGKPKKMNQEQLHSIQYHHQALKVVNLLLDNNVEASMVNGLRDDLYPKHLGRIGYDDKVVNCDLDYLKLRLLAQISSNESKYNKHT